MDELHKQYQNAKVKRDTKIQYFIQILNGEMPGGISIEILDDIKSIVHRWLQNTLTDEDYEKLNGAWRNSTPSEYLGRDGNQRGISVFTPSLIPYIELFERLSDWEKTHNERLKPYECLQCGTWFTPARSGRFGPKYCSRPCTQKASNIRNSESIKRAVKEGRTRGDYQ